MEWGKTERDEEGQLAIVPFSETSTGDRESPEEPSAYCSDRVSDRLAQLKFALADRYTIQRPIGRGGTATVYLAEEIQPPRRVAIKVLDEALGGWISRERFLREVDIASQLTHTHIVPIFAAGEVEGVLYHVMPYIDGPSLRVRLAREKQLALDNAVEITREVAGVLSYAHGLGIVHRDIKPENILFEVGEAVVTDFGIACAIDSAVEHALTQDGRPIGTPAYMSPEQAAGSGEVDGRTDIYGLACVLFEMLSGTRPPWGWGLGPITLADRQKAPPYLSGVPPAVHDVLRRALAWDPAERFGSASDFAVALNDAHASASAAPSQYACTPAAEVPQKSVVVLPFANMSADAENDYFSDGITDDIITRLSKIPGLRVTSRTSAMHYKNSDKTIRTIGVELGVGTALEGSVRRAGDRVRITAQLIDVQTDAHVWAETYDRDLTDIFELQSDVADKIVGACPLALM